MLPVEPAIKLPVWVLVTARTGADTVKVFATLVPSTVTVAVPEAVAVAVVTIAALELSAVAVEFVVLEPCTIVSVARTLK